MRCSGKAARTQPDTAVSSAGRSTARLRLPQGGGARRFRISLWVGVVCVWGGVGDVGLGRVAQADVVDLAPLGVPRARVVEVEQALEARHLRAEERARVEDAPLGAARQRPAGICERSQLPHAKPGVCTERRAGMRHRAAHWEASRENKCPVERGSRCTRVRVPHLFRRTSASKPRKGGETCSGPASSACAFTPPCIHDAQSVPPTQSELLRRRTLRVARVCARACVYLCVRACCVCVHVCVRVCVSSLPKEAMAADAALGGLSPEGRGVSERTLRGGSAQPPTAARSAC